MNEDPAGVTVSATSEYKDMKGLMEAIKLIPVS